MTCPLKFHGAECLGMKDTSELTTREVLELELSEIPLERDHLDERESLLRSELAALDAKEQQK